MKLHLLTPDLPAEPYSLDLPRGVRVEIRPRARLLPRLRCARPRLCCSLPVRGARTLHRRGRRRVEHRHGLRDGIKRWR